MNEMDVRRLGLIFATRTEVDGMKAENELRKQNNESPAYGDADFQAKADELTNIAYFAVMSNFKRKIIKQ